jgi:membrane-associated phospholipid phosphatase
MLGHTASAQSNGPEQSARERVHTVAGDAKAYVLAPLHATRPQWVRFGAVMGAVVFAYSLDDDVREHFGTPLLPAGEEPDMHDSGDAAPALLALGGTWLASALSDNDDGKREAGMMFEAAAFSSVAAYALKEIAGRERPFANADRSSFGDGGDSFPSMHVTAAFAIGTVLAESGNQRARWLRRVLGYGLAAGTAYARMDHDVHWFSDTVAGAGLGVATARFVMKRREEAESRGRFGVVPTRYGVELAYTMPLR